MKMQSHSPRLWAARGGGSFFLHRSWCLTLLCSSGKRQASLSQQEFIWMAKKKIAKKSKYNIALSPLWGTRVLGILVGCTPKFAVWQMMCFLHPANQSDFNRQLLSPPFSPLLLKRRPCNVPRGSETWTRQGSSPPHSLLYQAVLPPPWEPSIPAEQ